MESGVRKSCLFYIQNASRIQPLLTTFIAIPLAQENACLVSLLPSMPTLVDPQHSSQSSHLKTQVTPCCSSAQKPTVAPTFLKYKIQNPTLASRALRDQFPVASLATLPTTTCFLCSNHPGPSAVL